ncbi:MAG: substrate-binding domain-containing protein [Nitrososphaerales archaeon]
MNNQPKKLDRRKFLYAGLGAAIVVVGGLAAYFATRPPERIVETVEKPVEKTVVQTQIQTVERTIQVTETPAKKLRLGYITRLSVPWWIVAEEGFKAGARKNGAEPVIYHPPELTSEDQVRVLDSWVAAGLDGIMIGPNDPAAPIDVINRAIDRGVPVVTGFGVDSPKSKRLLFLGYDPYQLGVALGKGMVKLLELAGKKPPGTITYHTGGMASTEDVASWEGFKKIVEGAGYKVVEPILDGGDAAKAVALAEQAIKLYPDLVGMLGYYDYTGPALGKAVTDAGKQGQIIVHADGLIGPMVPYFQSGVIGATIELRQYEGSLLGAEILAKCALTGKAKWDDIIKQYVPEYPAKKELLLPFGWVTGKKLDVKPWPELGWIKTLDEFKNEFPEVWKIIG